ncbi:MAG: hypothetical protein H0X31_21835 [Nostocaceae cyanobacterium]|nr:hypothetical protein [Nostocaceae cyanobacterium]
MNAGLPRFFKSVYRKEPLPSILLTMGVVEAVIGGFDDSWSLLVFGIGTVSVAFALRWWFIQQRRPLPEEPVVQRFLPERSSSPAAPMTTVYKKKPRVD